MHADNTPNSQAVVLQVIEEHRARAGALLPILHGIQASLGYVPPEAVTHIALALNLSRAEVHGVVTYYHYFRQEPAGKHTLQICRAESCRSMGAEALLQEAHRLNGSSPSRPTSRDSVCTVEPVYCLGFCAQSPAVMLDELPSARVTAEKLAEILESVRRTAGDRSEA